MSRPLRQETCSVFHGNQFEGGVGTALGGFGRAYASTKSFQDKLRISLCDVRLLPPALNSPPYVPRPYGFDDLQGF